MSNPSPELEAGPVDFAIVTALRVERDAMLRHLEELRTISAPGDPRQYYRGKVSIPGSSAAYQVVLFCMNDAGNVLAATETTALIHRWQPKQILMVGIAGGIRKRGVGLGDVLVAEYVHYYEPAKMTPGAEQRRFRQYRCDYVLFRKAQNYEASDWKAGINSARPDGVEGGQPQVHFDSLGCGEQVVADEARIDELLRECPKMVGVAMEGAGVWMGAETTMASENCRFLEVRGVSDFADAKKSDDWHLYAAEAAAAFTAGYLRSKPVWSLAEEESTRNAKNAMEAPRVAILRLQSLRNILPDEIIPALPEVLRQRDRDTYALDFTDLLTGADRDIASPEKAVQRVMAAEGPLLELLGRAGGGDLVVHGLVHIPLAVLAGHLVSDRMPTHLFDFHPSPGEENWSWPQSAGDYPQLISAWKKRPRAVRGPDVVSLRVSVSYTAFETSALRVVPPGGTRVALELPTPTRGVVQSEEQMRAYGQSFRTVLDKIVNDLPDCEQVHLFYAGPVALAFHLGQQISENIHPPVVVWNFRRQAGGYNWGIDLGRATRGEPGAVLRPSLKE